MCKKVLVLTDQPNRNWRGIAKTLEESMTGVNPILTSIPGTQLMGEVRDLKDVAEKFNKESDTLQEILGSVNNKLALLNIGLDVWLSERPPYSAFCYGSVTTEKNRDQEAWDLGYTKLPTAEGWCLAVRKVKSTLDDDGYESFVVISEPGSLLKAPRPVRIKAIEFLPKLIDALKAEAENGISAIQKAREIADKL